MIELVASSEVVVEYFELLERVHVDEHLVERFENRLYARETVTWVNLGPRVVASRDRDDDVFLSTAKTGRASFLATNDRDLLDLDPAAHKRLRFDIVTPQTLLTRLAEK